MFTQPVVYLIKGSNGRHYLGSTDNLERRLHEHRTGKTHTTQRLGATLTVVACRKCPSLEAARALERELKRKKNPTLIAWHLSAP